MPDEVWYFSLVITRPVINLVQQGLTSLNSRVSVSSFGASGTLMIALRALLLLLRPGLLEAWLALTSVKYHGNLQVLTPLKQRLALTRFRTTGPSLSMKLWSFLKIILTEIIFCLYFFVFNYVNVNYIISHINVKGIKLQKLNLLCLGRP